jgi:Tol biopolymer transport system component
VDSDGEEANGNSGGGTLSATGRFAIFSSEGDNLVEGDTNGVWDVFVRDIRGKATTRASLSSQGEQPNDYSLGGGISSNGRFVAFNSGATNLIPNDENGGSSDVFLRDRTAGTTTVISVSSNGAQGNSRSGAPRMSPNGRFVAFVSAAGNLVPDDLNDRDDVFVRDRWAGVTTRVSINSLGEEGNGNSGSFGRDLTPDGRFVVFDSDADNLVNDDENRSRDIFVHDRDFDEDGIFDEPGAIETVRVSVGNGWESEGDSLSASISADGRFIAFDGWARIVGADFNEDFDIFLHDRQTHVTRLVSLGMGGRAGNSGSFLPSISADGTMITFFSQASDLVPNDHNETADVFIYHVAQRTIERAVMGMDGEEPDGCTFDSTFAAGGCSIGFSSIATNLVEGDTNGEHQVYMLQLCIPGDFDGDERVDHADFETFAACLTGPGVRPGEACRKPDLDVDLDVDLYDFTILQANYAGE